MEISILTQILLGLVVVNLLVWPLVSKWVENHLEIFLLLVGAAAVTISGGWSKEFVYQTLNAPVNVAFIVLVVSIIFNYYSRYIFRVLFILFRYFEPKYSFAILVFLLGMTSSVFSVTVAALILAEVLQVVNLERSQTVRVTVYACYAIGLGAVLLPLAEPLGLVIYNELAAGPHQADFFFMLQHFFWWIMPAILLLALAAGYTLRDVKRQRRHPLHAAPHLACVFVCGGFAFNQHRAAPVCPEHHCAFKRQDFVLGQFRLCHYRQCHAGGY